MRARLIAYAGTAFAASAVAAASIELVDEVVLQRTDSSRAVAYQTFAGTGAALMTVQLAMLAFFMATSRGSRLRAVLARSNGAGAASIGADTAAAFMTALAFAVLIVVDPIWPNSSMVIGAGLIGVQVAIGLHVAQLAYLAMRTVEREALTEAREAYAAAAARFDEDLKV